jgi:acyl-CoA synthetase (AMP-forming)/AMP-acid ligase II
MRNPVLQRWATACPPGPALFSTSGEILRTGADIQAEAAGFLGRLVGNVGAVALQTGNHVSFPALLLAAWQAGRAVCLYDGDLRGGLREELDAELGVTLRVTAEASKLRFDRVPGSGAAGKPSDTHDPDTGWAGPPGLPPLQIPCDSASRDVPTSLKPFRADLYKLTSGTVSRPRALGFSAGQLLSDCDQVCASMGLGGGDVNYGVISFAHSYGFSNLITPLLCHGIPLVVATDPLPRAIQSGLLATRASVLPAVPAMFRALLSCDELPASLRLCISAGAPLDPVLGRDFLVRFSRKIHSFYGASECGGICYDRSDALPDVPGFVGQPLDGVEIEVLDPSGPSRIRVFSATVGDGFFEPSDLLVRESDGFRIVGRESDFLNVGGRKTSPEDIEAVLVRCPGVREAVVCGIDDPIRGQEICALIAGTGEPASLRQHCATYLPNWKIPRRFAFADKIPLTPRGKISRAAIVREFFVTAPCAEE